MPRQGESRNCVEVGSIECESIGGTRHNAQSTGQMWSSHGYEGCSSVQQPWGIAARAAPSEPGFLPSLALRLRSDICRWPKAGGRELEARRGSDQSATAGQPYVASENISCRISVRMRCINISGCAGYKYWTPTVDLTSRTQHEPQRLTLLGHQHFNVNRVNLSGC